MLKKIIEFSLHHRIIIILSVIALVFLGIITINQIPKEFLPNLGSPIVNIITERPGLAPEEVENLITRPIENKIQSLPNVLNIRSETRSGVSLVTVTFKWGTNHYLATQLISQSLAEVTPSLPGGTKPPFLSTAASRLGEVMQYYVTSDKLSLMDLRELADYDIRMHLKAVPGVAEVSDAGGEVRQFQVLVNQNRMRYYQIGLDEIETALKNDNTNFSGGVITDGNIEFSILGLGRIHELKELYTVVVATRNNIPVYLKDVAIVREGAAIRTSIITVNGKEAVSGTVVKQYGSDTQPVIEGVKDAIKKLKPYLPASVKIVPYFNQEELMNIAVRNLRDTLWIGGLAMILVVFLFLSNIRSAFIIAVTLPVSVIITFIFMNLFGITTNVMSLGGIAVGLGIMIDAAIVDTENIYRWIRLHPDDTFLSTLRGSIEVRKPVAYSTAIISAVFIPLLFLSGFEGKLFMPFAFTIVMSILVGFVLSVTLTPVLCYTLLGKYKFNQSKPGEEESWLTKKFSNVYQPTLNKALKHPKTSVLIVLIILMVTLLLTPLIGSRLLPSFDENGILLKVSLPSGTTLKHTAEITDKILSMVKNIPDVKETIGVIGRPEESQDVEGSNNFSENYIQLVDWKKRTLSIPEIENLMRKKVGSFPGAVVTFETPLNDAIEESISGSSGQLSVKIFGPDYNLLIQDAVKLKKIMQSIPELKDIYLEQYYGLPQLNIEINKIAASRYGLDVKEIANSIETAIQGRKATTVINGIKEYDVFIRLQKKFRNEIYKINSVLVETPSGKYIKLGQLANIWEDTGPLLIQRENQDRLTQITCNVTGGNINEAVAKIKSKISTLNLPKGYTVDFGGNYKRQHELNKEVLTTLILSIIVVFILLLAAFNSVWQAVLVIFTIPLALMGGVWAMFLTVTTFSVSALIGFVAHFGLTVQKGIILIEYINKLRSEGIPIHQALVLAGKTRMRPVLMTASAASLGVLPLALGIGAGAEIQQPMAIVLIGGLMVSTPIILIILPVLYSIISKFLRLD